MFRLVTPLRRLLAAAAALVALAAVVPALASSRVTPPQAAPAFLSHDNPVPGTSKNVTLVGHLAPPGAGTTTPAGQYAALAVGGDCAFIGRRNFNSSNQANKGLGVQVVNISNPAAPVYVGQVPHTAFTDSTARELRAIPQDHLLLVLQYASSTTGVGVTVGTAPSVRQASNLMQAFSFDPTTCATAPLADYNVAPLRPHEFYTWLDPKVPGRVIAYVTTPFGPGELEAVDFSSCSTLPGRPAPACAPKLLTIWDGAYPQVNTAAIAGSAVGNYLHSLSISPDGKTGYMAFWDGGFFTVDTSQVAAGDPNPVIVGEASTAPRDAWANQGTGQGGDAHSAVWVPTDLSRTTAKPYVVLTDEDYLGLGDCPFGWVHIDKLQGNTPVRLSTYGLPENTLTQELALITGTQANLDPVTSLDQFEDPNTCAGFNRDHPGFIGAEPGSQWPANSSGQRLVPANTYTSHNPTTLPDLILLTWYGGGFQVVNIHDPSRPAEAGYFVPTPEAKVVEQVDDATGTFLGCYHPDPDAAHCATQFPGGPTYDASPGVESWSYPIIRDGLIYFADNRNGLYIVSYSGRYASEVSRTGFAEGNSNNTAALISGQVAGQRAGAAQTAVEGASVTRAASPRTASAHAQPRGLMAQLSAAQLPLALPQPLVQALLALLLAALGYLGLRFSRKRA